MFEKRNVDTHWFQKRLAERGMSQVQLAGFLGVSTAAVSHMFSGKRGMDIREAATIATLLDVPVQDVLRHADAYAGVPRAGREHEEL